MAVGKARTKGRMTMLFLSPKPHGSLWSEGQWAPKATFRFPTGLVWHFKEPCAVPPALPSYNPYGSWR